MRAESAPAQILRCAKATSVSAVSVQQCRSCNIHHPLHLQQAFVISSRSGYGGAASSAYRMRARAGGTGRPLVGQARQLEKTHEAVPKGPFDGGSLVGCRPKVGVGVVLVQRSAPPRRVGPSTLALRPVHPPSLRRTIRLQDRKWRLLPAPGWPEARLSTPESDRTAPGLRRFGAPPPGSARNSRKRRST